jgi:hypothetical protein
VRTALGVMLTVAAVAVSGCYGAPKQPPLPSAERSPTTVGQIVARDDDNVTYHLAGGDRVVVRARSSGGPSELLSSTNVALPDVGLAGGLLLVGEDGAGPFHAATDRPSAGCFPMRGQGYIDRDRIHLSSGLVLPLAGNFQVTDQRSQGEDSWFLGFDLICLDDRGTVTSITQLALGA